MPLDVIVCQSGCKHQKHVGKQEQRVFNQRRVQGAAADTLKTQVKLSLIHI